MKPFRVFPQLRYRKKTETPNGLFPSTDQGTFRSAIRPPENSWLVFMEDKDKDRALGTSCILILISRDDR